jgi:LCP family protein required for cell wall assembly
MKFLKILLLTILLVAFTACNIPQPAVGRHIVLITPNPNATATPTPFLPFSFTPTVTSDQPVPATQEGPLPTPIGGRPLGQKLILILGSDYRPDSGFRTDVILLVAVNPYDGTVKMLSFPRDLYIEIPGYGYERINVVQQLGGFELTASTFEYNFGVRPDYYLMTNFQGFTYIVDTLGGITVNVRQDLTDQCKLPIAAADGTCTLYAGQNNLDGQTALWYVRSRHSSSDFDRERRSQEILEGLFFKLMNMNAVMRAPELYSLLSSSVDTNLALTDMVGLLAVAPSIFSDPNRVSQFTITPNEVYNYITASGAMVLIPDYNAVQNLIYQAVYLP